MNIITGSILDATEQYIAHQCNCHSRGSAGLAYALFQKFPYANDYKNRATPDVPGTIRVHGDGIDQRYVINMFAQVYPGQVWPPENPNDTLEIRAQLFSTCLDAIATIINLNSIAFPANIGCGLAGGNWDRYYEMLKEFANKLTNTEVNIYQRKEDRHGL